MKEARFTKGEWIGNKNGKWFADYEWELSNDNCSSYSNISIGSESGGVVAIVPMKGFDNDCELHANAHLIAAAPEMYGMLERILKPYGREDISDDAIENLLAKARGEHEQTN